MTPSSHSPTLATLLLAMAVGRIVLGAASPAAPGAMARTFGTRTSPELDYMTRVFGSRAIGLSELFRTSGASRRSLATAVMITGPYAAIGAARLVSDLRHAG
jgi:hypothetical protein